MSKIITFSGKGGVGKTTTTALLLDEMARLGYQGRLLVVDGDPATTLYLALSQTPPVATIADVRDELKLDAKTIHNLPAGQTPAQYVAHHLLDQQVLLPMRLREMRFDALALGWGEGRPGCYCSINNALSQVQGQLLAQYDLVIVDNEAGLEHLSRYRLQEVALFVTVETDQMASMVVAERIRQVALSVGMKLDEMMTVRISSPAAPTEGRRIGVPRDPAVSRVLGAGLPVYSVSSRSSAREALKPLVNRVLTLGGSDSDAMRAAAARYQNIMGQFG